MENEYYKLITEIPYCNFVIEKRYYGKEKAKQVAEELKKHKENVKLVKVVGGKEYEERI